MDEVPVLGLISFVHSIVDHMINIKDFLLARYLQ